MSEETKPESTNVDLQVDDVIIETDSQVEGEQN